MLNFNPRSRVGNDGNIQADAGSLSISIHVPAWGTTVFCSGRSISCAISIHVPAWGTTKYLFIMYGIVKISIHVPAWGTTDLCPDALGWGLISIHVPAWGTTIMVAILASLNLNFNPRSRVGNDGIWRNRPDQAKNFNPRSRVGNDAVAISFPPY